MKKLGTVWKSKTKESCTVSGSVCCVTLVGLHQVIKDNKSPLGFFAHLDFMETLKINVIN